jgi:glycosyltransferase involved in cell wall biosynthesis
MKTIVLVGKVLSPTLKSDIASGAVPRVVSLELARILGAEVLDYRDVAKATEPAVLAARIRSPAWGLAVLAAVRRDRYQAVFATGEDVAIPLAFVLKGLRVRRRLTVVVHNGGALSRRASFPLLGRDAWSDLICLSDEQQRILVEQLGDDSGLIHRLDKWVDTDFFDPGRADAEDGQGYVFSCGREKRDYGTLQRAAEKVPYPFWVVASGWWPQRGFRPFEGLIPTANMRVDQGTLSFSQLRAAYAGARFVVVSLEAVGYAAGVSTIFEALAMGKAVVATASPGIAEFVEDQVNGLVVPTGDADSLAAAIDELWNDPARCEDMGRRNRRLAEEAFSFDGHVSAVVDLITA